VRHAGRSTALTRRRGFGATEVIGLEPDACKADYWQR